MENQFTRSELVIGHEAIKKLNNSKVAIFGVGGVGSFVVEGLARAGIGKFILIDNDTVSISNINRQLIATHKTIGMSKVDVAKSRILDINPNAKVEIIQEFYLPKSEIEIITKDIDYVVDAIDTVTAKIDIIEKCKKFGIKVISAMGTGNKLNPLAFEVTDIYKTTVCPLAKVIRKELRKRNIQDLKVVYSKEEPVDTSINRKEGEKQVPGSISFVPSVAGMIVASEVVKDLIKEIKTC